MYRFAIRQIGRRIRCDDVKSFGLILVEGEGGIVQVCCPILVNSVGGKCRSVLFDNDDATKRGFQISVVRCPAQTRFWVLLPSFLTVNFIQCCSELVRLGVKLSEPPA